MDVKEQLTEAQKRFFSDLSDAQERVIDLNRRISEAAAGWRSRLETPRVPTLKIDSSLGEDLVATYFDFAGKLLGSQKSFVTKIVDVWTAPGRSTASTSASRSKAKAKVAA